MPNDFRYISKDASGWGFLVASVIGALFSLGTLLVTSTAQASAATNTTATATDYSLVATYAMCIFMHLRSYLRIILTGVDFDHKDIFVDVPSSGMRILLYVTFLALVLLTSLSVSLLRTFGPIAAFIAFGLLGLMLIVLWLIIFYPVFFDDTSNLVSLKQKSPYVLSLIIDICTLAIAIFLFGFILGHDGVQDTAKIMGLITGLFVLLFFWESYHHLGRLKELFVETKQLLSGETLESAANNSANRSGESSEN